MKISFDLTLIEGMYVLNSSEIWKKTPMKFFCFLKITYLSYKENILLKAAFLFKFGMTGLMPMNQNFLITANVLKITLTKNISCSVPF